MDHRTILCILACLKYNGSMWSISVNCTTGCYKNVLNFHHPSIEIVSHLIVAGTVTFASLRSKVADTHISFVKDASKIIMRELNAHRYSEQPFNASSFCTLFFLRTTQSTRRSRAMTEHADQVIALEPFGSGINNPDPDSFIGEVGRHAIQPRPEQ